MEELEEEWVDEGVWVEGAAEDFGHRMFLCNICSRARDRRDVLGLPQDESQRPVTVRQKLPRDGTNRTRYLDLVPSRPVLITDDNDPGMKGNTCTAVESAHPHEPSLMS
jgi:hypothetical protein